MAYGALNSELRCDCGTLLTRLENGQMKCFNCDKIYDFEIVLEEVKG